VRTLIILMLLNEIGITLLAIKVLKLQTGATDYCDYWRSEIHGDIKARIQKYAQYKIRSANGNELCGGMDLGRGVCEAFEVLALAIPSFTQLWKIMKDCCRCSLSHNGGWFRLDVWGKGEFRNSFNKKINESMCIFIQCVINCFTEQYQFKDMRKGYLDVQVAQ